jgi:hypothetical protein
VQAVRDGTTSAVGPVGISFDESEGPATDGSTPDHPLALVEWHDAWFDLDQEGPEDCRADYLVRTVGFLVREGPRFLSLAQEILPDGEGLRAVTHIPLAIVERVTRLERSVETTDPMTSPHLASG